MAKISAYLVIMELFLHTRESSFFLKFFSVIPISGIGRMKMNSLKKYRERLLISKAELARKAGISTLTIDRVEKGKSCRLETKRKIILALGLDLSDRGKIFGKG